MTDSPDLEFTVLLSRYREGEDELRNVLISLLYSDLRRIARHHMRSNRWMDTLNTTVLVNEVYFRLISPSARHVSNRAHFLNLAAAAMRQITCDYARKRLREHVHVDRAKEIDDLDDSEIMEDTQARQVLWLHDALNDLAKVNERGVRVIECRFFAGFTEEETAQAIGVSLRTVERTWAEAKAWLADYMTDENPG